MNRWKASAIHFVISAVIAFTALALMLLFWFAPPFFSAAGGRHVLLIMLGVDVTLGPLITLIIFNTQKSRKMLTFDFTVIAALQIFALLYGAIVMFNARPVYVVFIKDSFDLVVAGQLSKQDLSQTKYAVFQSLPLTGPVYAYSEMPANVQERNEVILALTSGKDLSAFPQYYMPYAEHASAVGAVARPMAELRKLNPSKINEIDTALLSDGLLESDIGFVPLRSKFEAMAVIVNKRDGKVHKILNMSPW